MYASTARQKNARIDPKDGDPNNNGTVPPGVADGQSAGKRAHHQHARQGLVERSADPEQESQFQQYYKNPVLATAFKLVYGVPS